MRLKNKILAVNSLIQAKLYKKRAPLIVTWGITTRCNSKCKYCNIWRMQTEELGTKQVFSIIEELSQMGVLKIQFTGGEPLLREDIGQIIDFCKQRGINTTINSNGSLVKKKIGELKNLDILNLSLDGPESTHDYLRGEGSYQGVMEAAKIARDKNIRIRFTTVLSKENLDAVGFILEKGKEFDAPVLFQPAMIHLLGSSDPNPMAPREEKYKWVINGLLIKKRRNRYIGNSAAGLKHLYNWPQKTKISCLKGMVSCKIESNGEVYICPQMKEKMRPVNCVKRGFREAFYNLSIFYCDSCWCAGNVEINCLLSLKLNTILNAVKLI